jgi:hypothetical protein
MELRATYLFLIPLTFFASTVQAAELAGRIWFENSKQSARQMHVVVGCADKVRHVGTTDHYGFYRCTDIPAKQSCYIWIDDGQHFSDPLLFDSGQGRDTQNFSVLLKANKLIVRKH